MNSPQPTEPSRHTPSPLRKPRPSLKAPAGCRWSPLGANRPRPPAPGPARHLRPRPPASSARAGRRRTPSWGSLIGRGRGQRAGSGAAPTARR